MTFLSPIFFWSLLTLIPLGAVYLMKTRPRKRVTNALFLWERILEEKASQFWFRKLRNLFSLLIMVLVTLLACLSLTEPQRKGQQSQDLLIIIDRSASMQTVEGGRSRFALAVDQARGWLRSIEGGNRVALASVGDTFIYHCHLSPSARVVRDALAQIEVSDQPLQSHLLDQIGMLLQTESSSYRVLFLTDGASDISVLPNGVEVIRIGEASDNVGITAADIALQPQGGGRLFFSITSSRAEDAALELELRHIDSGEIAKLITVTAPAHETFSEVVELDSLQPGLWELALLEQDSLVLDNRVELGVNQPAPIPIAIRTENTYFYERCVEAFAHAENLLTLAEGEAITIAEGRPIPSQLGGLLFAPVADVAVGIGEVLPEVVAQVERESHPLIKHLDAESLPYPAARQMQAPEGAIVVVQEVGGTPLIYTVQQEGQRIVVMNFDPAQGDFYLSPWFPVLVHNAARFLAGRQDELPALAQIGTSVSISGEQNTIERRVTTSEVINQVSGGPQSLQALGGYHFSSGHQDWYTGAAVLSEWESGGQQVSDSLSGQAEPPSSWPIAWYLLVVSALALLGEEVLYHRRKVG